MVEEILRNSWQRYIYSEIILQHRILPICYNFRNKKCLLAELIFKHKFHGFSAKSATKFRKLLNFCKLNLQAYEKLANVFII